MLRQALSRTEFWMGFKNRVLHKLNAKFLFGAMAGAFLRRGNLTL